MRKGIKAYLGLTYWVSFNNKNLFGVSIYIKH